MEDRQITVGSIRRPHGLKGELAFNTDISDISLFLSIRNFTLKNKRETMEVAVESVRGSVNRHIIKFEDLNSLAAVEGLASWELVTWRSCVPGLPDGEYYHFDIIGMCVCLEDGSEFGSITGIMETGANDVYIVKGAAGQEYLIPGTKEVVKKIDIEKREMVIAPLEGMLEDV